MEKDVLEFCRELKDLLEKYDVSLGVDVEGDTYGIDVNGFYVYAYGKKYLRLSNIGDLYLDANDLKTLIKVKELTK